MTNRQLGIEAKKRGYEYICTIVKQVYNTRYYNVTNVDRLIHTGQLAKCYSNGRYRVGTIESALPAKSVTRTALRAEIKKQEE